MTQCDTVIIKVDLPPPVHFSMCTEGFPYKTYGVRKRNLGIASINRQIQKYVANHNEDGPKTKSKNEEFSHSTFFSTLLYVLFSTIRFVWKTFCTHRKVDRARGWQIYFDLHERGFSPSKNSQNMSYGSTSIAYLTVALLYYD